MTIVFQPKIVLPAGAVAPDSYDESNGYTPPDSLVVSRNRDGTAASTYGELAWDLSAYHPEHRKKNLYFSFWKDGALTHQRELLSRETRWIMLVLMWKLPGPSLSLGSILNYGVMLRALASFAEEHSCQVQVVLETEALIREFAKAQSHGTCLRLLSALLKNLSRIGKAELGFDVAGTNAKAELKVQNQKHMATYKQIAPMPTRIYAAVLERLSAELADWEAVAPSFLALVNECSRDRLVGRSLSARLKACRDDAECGRAAVATMTFTELQNKHGVATYCSAKDLECTVRGLTTGLLKVQLIAKLVIQAFSGMRHDEARALPQDCLEVTKSNGNTHYIIQGRTTKLNHGQVKRTRWVTNLEGCRAIRIAKEIADAIYTACGATAQSEGSATGGRVLFVNPRYCGLAGRPASPPSVYLTGSLALSEFSAERSRLQPIIEEGDLLELEQLDPHRAWRTEPLYAIGQPWTLKPHQFRRSLALYAQASGLVSLPSLRRQLQHITDEMSRYYARGSAMAKDFVGEDKTHFGYEWQETETESAALGYMLKVLLSGVAMSGGHGNWVNHRLRNAEGVVVFDRARTLRAFDKRELAYRETILGGCTNTGECDRSAFDWLDIGCLAGCPNMVVKLPNLERVIAAQTRFVAAQDTTSLEYRTEKRKLEKLVVTKLEIQRQLEGTAK